MTDHDDADGRGEEQALLFPVEELVPWLAEWQNMPEYSHEDLEPKYQIIVSFACAADVEDFGRAIGQELSASDAARQLPSIWYPEQEIGRYANKRYVEEK